VSEEPENHTIRLLQQIREEIREQFQEVREQFQTVNARIDGVTHIMTLLAGHTYHLDERVTKLEKKVF